jgi:hypothetical protein
MVSTPFRRRGWSSMLAATRHSVLVKLFTSYAICREQFLIPDLC